MAASAPSSASVVGLTSVQKHVENFAPSGVVDLSERNLISPDPLECFATAIAREVAAGIWCLDLARNHLSTLPASVTRPLVGLTELTLSRNGFDAFPAALCQLPALTTLDLSSNALETLAVSAEVFDSGLPRLESLILARNRLTQIPPCIGRSAALRRLNLSANRLALGVDVGGGGEGDDRSEGEPLRGAVRLSELLLDDNGLMHLPHGILQWPLTHLSLAGNRLAALPPAVRDAAPTLTALDVSRNSLRALPPALGHCVALTSLDVALNEALAWPPPEVMRRPLAAILEWLRGNAAGPVPSGDLEAERAAAATAAAREAAIAGLHAELAALRAAYEELREASEAERAKRAAAAETAAAAEAEASRLEASLESECEQKAQQQQRDARSVRDAAAKVAAIPKKHLEELRQLPNPPTAVMRTMQAVHALLEAGGAGGAGAANGGAHKPASLVPSARLRTGTGAAVLAATPPPPSVATATSSSYSPRSPTVSKLKTAAKRLAAGAAVTPAPPTAADALGGGGGDVALASWEAVRGTLQKSFVQRVRAFDASRVPAEACALARSTLPSGADAPTAVSKASVACAPLFEWARASLDLAASMRAAAPVEAELARLEAELAALRERRAAALDEAGSTERLSRLEMEAESMRCEVAAAEELAL